MTAARHECRLRGEVGEALGTGRSIAEMIGIRLPTTLTLGGLTAAIAVPTSPRAASPR